MWRKITLISTYIVSGIAILLTIGDHVNYMNYEFNQYGKNAVPMVEQHLYTAIMLSVFFILITAVATYFLRPKK